MSTPLPVAPTGEQMVAILSQAYEIGSLAMAHYYHGDYAGDDWKMNHAERAQRPEHIEWAIANYPRLHAELERGNATIKFSDYLGERIHHPECLAFGNHPEPCRCGVQP